MSGRWIGGDVRWREVWRMSGGEGLDGLEEAVKRFGEANRWSGLSVSGLPKGG